MKKARKLSLFFVDCTKRGDPSTIRIPIYFPVTNDLKKIAWKIEEEWIDQTGRNVKATVIREEKADGASHVRIILKVGTGKKEPAVALYAKFIVKEGYLGELIITKKPIQDYHTGRFAECPYQIFI